MEDSSEVKDFISTEEGGDYYLKMIKSGDYTISYVAKMAEISRKTLYNWQEELDLCR